MAPLHLNKLSLSSSHQIQSYKKNHLASSNCSILRFSCQFNQTSEAKEGNKVLTSELPDQSCRRAAAHERGAEIVQDSTWAPHLAHQQLLEDASDHPTNVNVRFLGRTDISFKRQKIEVSWIDWTHTVSLQPDFDIRSTFLGSTKISHQKVVFPNLAKEMSPINIYNIFLKKKTLPHPKAI